MGRQGGRGGRYREVYAQAKMDARSRAGLLQVERLENLGSLADGTQLGSLMRSRTEKWIYGGISTAIGVFALFPYFLPDGMLRPHLHENPIVVGILGAVALFLGGFIFGNGHS